MDSVNSTTVWGVVIERNGVEKNDFYSLPTSTPLRDIKKMFTQDIGLHSERGAFLNIHGTKIDDDQILSQVGEAVPGLKVVKLKYQEEEEVEIKVLGGEEASKSLVCQPTTTPESLLPVARSLFHPATEGRDIRLRSDAGILESNIPVLAQLSDTPLLLELGARLEFRDQWDGAVIALDGVFPSDDCQELLKKVADQGGAIENEDGVLSKIYLNGHQIRFRGRAIDALTSHGVPWQPCYPLLMETSRLVTCTRGCIARQHQMGSSEKVRRQASKRDTDRAEPMFDLDLLEDGIVIEDPVVVTLNLSNGLRRRIRMPKWATVGDLRSVATKLERQSKQIFLRRGRTVFDDDCLSLSQAGIVSDPNVQSEVDLLILTVAIGNRTVTLCPRRRRLTSSQLISDVAAEADVLYSSLSSSGLQCEGCGRRIWGKETCQSVPADCCSVQSRRLAVWASSEDHADNSNNADLKCKIESLQKQLGDKQSLIDKFQEEIKGLTKERQRLQRSEKEMQKKIKDLEEEITGKQQLATTNDELQKKVRNYEEEKRMHSNLIEKYQKMLKGLTEQQSATTVEPHKPADATRRASEPPKPIKVNLWILNFCQDFNKRRDFAMELVFPHFPTVGELRDSVAKHMNRTAEKTGLRRGVGRSGGQRIYEIRKRNHDLFFADVTGKLREWRSGSGREGKDLTRDADAFEIVEGYENVLRVLPC